MYTRNSAEAQGESVSAINNGGGSQYIDARKTINRFGSSLVNLAETVKGAIVFDPIIMREVILRIDSKLEKIENPKSDLNAISINEKNELNGLSQDFYDEFISVDFEPYFQDLDNFLKQRENEDLLKKIYNIASNLNKKIYVNRKKFDTFEELLLSIEDALLDSEYISLQGKENRISFFFYYLYASCLIGKKTDKEKKC